MLESWHVSIFTPVAVYHLVLECVGSQFTRTFYKMPSLKQRMMFLVAVTVLLLGILLLVWKEIRRRQRSVSRRIELVDDGRTFAIRRGGSDTYLSETIVNFLDWIVVFF